MDAATFAHARADAGPWTPALAACAIFTLAAVVLLHPTAARMTATWFESSSYSHGALVAPIALWLAAANRRARALAPAPSFAAAPLAVGAALLWLLGRAAGAQIIEQIAFVSLLIAGVIAVFGPALARIWAFPLGFLFFMVPFGESLIPALQQFTATTAVGFLSLAGAPAAIDGVLITTPAGVFEVGEACAGLRFLIAAVMVSTLFAYLAVDGWRKRALFVVFASGLALAANALRAFMLILLATLTEKQFGVGPEHVFVGWLFYGAIFLILIAVGRRISDRSTRSADTIQPTGGTRRSLAAALISLLAIALAASGYARMVIEPRVAAAPAVLPLLSATGWRILPPSVEWKAHFRGADRTAHAAYQNPAAQVQASIAYYAYGRPGAEIVAYGNGGFDGSEWRNAGARRVTLSAFGAERSEIKFRFYNDSRGRRLAAATVYWFDDRIYASPLSLKLRQMQSRLKGAHAPGGVIIVVASAAEDDIDAIAAIAAFLRDVDSFEVWRRRLEAGAAR
ncbi:MAG: exosortase A [Parvularculaceae bacterium]